MAEKSIKVYDDKYEFYMKNHSIYCLRYGEEWRDFIGDGAVLQLFLHAEELREQNKQLMALLEVKQKIITQLMEISASITSLENGSS